MGYTHYLGHHTRFTDEQWDKLTTFTRAAIKATDIPIGDANGEGGKPEISDECIHFNGIGDDAYEDFYLSREPDNGCFCKTERKSYDVVVVAVLLYANEIARDSIATTSDGEIFGYGPDKWDERSSAMDLMNKVLNQ